MTSNLPTLPASWEWKKLGEIIGFQNGFAFKSNLFKSDGLPIIRISNIQNGTVDLNDVVYFNANDYKNLDSYRIYDGDFIIAMSGATTGKIGIFKNNNTAYLNQRVGKFIIQSETLKQYLFYFLTTQIEENLKKSFGAAQPNLSTEQIKNILLPLPPLDEQKRLVSILDTLFAKIDRSIELLSENITAANALLPSALNTVFGELGEQWETKKLGDIATVGTGVTPLKSKHEYYDNGTINWITSKATNNDFVLEAEQKISEVAMKECRLKIYSKGTLIVALYGQGKTRGQVSELMIDSTINQAIAAISVNKENSTSFIKYFFKKSYLELRDKASGGTQDNLNLSIIKSIEIPLPPLDIQTQTVAYLDTIRTKVEILKQVQNDKITHLKALKASILDRAFKGEL